MPGTNPYLTFDIKALILCDDSHFLPSLERVFAKLGVRSERAADYAAGLTAIADSKIDLVVVDWREIANLGEFFATLRSSKMNKQCLIVGIASDMLDLRQAFSAGVQYLIHKPASVVQIARCLQAAHADVIVKRRKLHREAVRIAATLHTRSVPLLGAMVVNLGAQGAGLKLNVTGCKTSASLSAGDDIDLSFISPASGQRVSACAVVVWVNKQGDAGVRFDYLPVAEQAKLERWLGGHFDRAAVVLRGRLQTA
jgi:ActR/RegA family two-component response regulator